MTKIISFINGRFKIKKDHYDIPFVVRNDSQAKNIILGVDYGWYNFWEIKSMFIDMI